jgi:hypothetical protein
MAVMIDPGVAQIGEGQAAQPGDGIVGVQAAAGDIVQQFSYRPLVHRTILPGKRLGHADVPGVAWRA